MKTTGRLVLWSGSCKVDREVLRNSSERDAVILQSTVDARIRAL